MTQDGFAPPDAGTVNIHASAVAIAGGAVLLVGPSGSGKSALALALMALGCRLISDDRCIVTLRDAALWVSAPAVLRGRIEARGIGILAADSLASAPVRLAVDLGRTETDRLPPPREFDLLGQRIPLVLGPVQPHFPPAILQYLLSGRIA